MITARRAADLAGDWTFGTAVSLRPERLFGAHCRIKPVAQATPGWLLLVIEFRVHAARDPVLSRRYAAVHARTVEGVAQALATVIGPDGEEPTVPARRLAELALALSTGTTLEWAASPDAFGGPRGAEQVAHVLESASWPAAQAAGPGTS